MAGLAGERHSVIAFQAVRRRDASSFQFRGSLNQVITDVPADERLTVVADPGSDLQLRRARGSKLFSASIAREFFRMRLQLEVLYLSWSHWLAPGWTGRRLKTGKLRSNVARWLPGRLSAAGFARNRFCGQCARCQDTNSSRAHSERAHTMIARCPLDSARRFRSRTSSR